MKTTFAEIRAALVRSEVGVGRPYPEAARRAALVLVEQKRREGLDLTRIAIELGMSTTTLRKWMRAAASTRRASTPFREVEIVTPPSASPHLIVHGPCGLRIEGATVADVAELLRRLA